MIDDLLPFLFSGDLPDLWTRAGGGQGFGGGSSGGGGRSSGGGGGDSSGLIELVLWLLIRHPQIGIPVLIIVVLVWAFSRHTATAGGKNQRQVYRTAAPPAASTSVLALQQRDPNFSAILFLDLARLVYLRAQEARGTGELGPVAPYLSPPALLSLQSRSKATEVRDVIIGASRIQNMQISNNEAHISVLLEANYTEMIEGKASQRWVMERWIYRRAANTLSPGPDRMRALSCANCGSPIDTTREGRCRNCDSLLTDARIQWQVEGISLLDQKLLPRILLQKGGGVEKGTDMPLVAAPDLPAAARALTARHPELHWPDFRRRVEEIFVEIQNAWSEGRWEKARPYETDFLFQQHRYWMERYAREGLRNRSADLRVTEVVPAKIAVDAYFEAITVRIFARMKDWTEDANGQVLGGSATQDRVFSEYWTFIRSAGKSAKPRENLHSCPSCGAPLDQVQQSGVCGYCDAKITGGEFDWVLAAIDQDEVYGG